MGIWEEKQSSRVFSPNVYRIYRKQISYFLLEEHVLCLRKRSSLRSFFPLSPLCCCLCRGTFPIPMETGWGTQFASLQRTLSIKLPRPFGFSQPRQWHQGSLWDLSCPWTPGPVPPRCFPSQNPMFFSSKSPTAGQKTGLIFPVKQWGYLSAASTTCLPNNIFSLDIFVQPRAWEGQYFLSDLKEIAQNCTTWMVLSKNVSEYIKWNKLDYWNSVSGFHCSGDDGSNSQYLPFGND